MSGSSDYDAMPQDAARWRPELADPRLDVVRRRVSAFYSSLAGWPGPCEIPPPIPPPDDVDPGFAAQAMPAPATPPPGRRTIDRSKPRMPLGAPQNPPADCVPCRQKMDVKPPE